MNKKNDKLYKIQKCLLFSAQQFKFMKMNLMGAWEIIKNENLLIDFKINGIKNEF